MFSVVYVYQYFYWDFNIFWISKKKLYLLLWNFCTKTCLFNIICSKLIICFISFNFNGDILFYLWNIFSTNHNFFFVVQLRLNIYIFMNIYKGAFLKNNCISFYGIKRTLLYPFVCFVWSVFHGWRFMQYLASFCLSSLYHRHLNCYQLVTK